MKRINRTAEIDEALRRGFGAEADLTNLVVYEVIAANTNPIRKKSGLYAGARFTPETLLELANLTNSESRQLINLHNGEMMPVGRLFQGRMRGESFHGLIALNNQTQASIVSDLDSGIIDQVSVSVLPKKLLCSECGWDYFSDAATFENIWDCVCGNGHAIGEGNCHARIVGVDAFIELSLCGMGAVPGARVINPSQSAFSATSPLGLRLAASNQPLGRLLIQASVEQPKDTKKMDLTVAIERIATLSAAEATVKAQLTALQASTDASIAALTGQVADLTAKLTAAEERAAAAAPATADVATLRAAVEDMTRRALIATGNQEPTLASDVSGLVTQLTDAQAKLTALIPQGPKSKSPGQLAAERPTSSRAFISTNA